MAAHEWARSWRLLLLATWACVLLLVADIGASAAQAAAPDRDEIRATRLLESIRDRPAKLRRFLEAMPKGGDLHNHLSGAVPTETLISYAVEDRLCIDTSTLTATPAPPTRPAGPLDALVPPAAATCPAGQRPASDSTTDPEFFEQILRAWSMHGFVPGSESGHDHFFATFGKFGLAAERKGDMLAAVARINADQNVAYLETLVSRQGSAVRTLAKKVGFDADFAALRSKLMANGLTQIVTAASADTDADIARFDQLLGCRTPTPEPACRLVVRFDHQVGRAVDPEVVFTNLLVGFELQRADARYVGVNLVQPEDNPVALRDYTLQMRMIGYLRSVYPAGHVTLHAGELVPGLVAPADLTFHIRQAVEIAGAERIGHGVSLMSETGYQNLLRTMARRHVLVEAPLTSNKQILGVSGAAHPFRRYRAAGVPVALATDDPGVSRVDFTHEFVTATTRHRLRYRALKDLARVSLEHAFLPGKSLWRSRDAYEPTGACARDALGTARPSRRCRALLRTSAKATVQWEHEARSNTFERRHLARQRRH